MLNKHTYKQNVGYKLSLQTNLISGSRFIFVDVRLSVERGILNTDDTWKGG